VGEILPSCEKELSSCVDEKRDKDSWVWGHFLFRK